MKTNKRFLSVLLSLALMLALVRGMSLTVYADTENYPVWIGGTQVTSEYHSGDGWSYTPATEGKDAKLTLNNYTYPGGVGYSDAAIYAEQNLVIELIGENKIVYQQTESENNCIEVTGHPAGQTDQHYLLTITGSGTLTAEIKSTTNQTTVIYADLLTIEKDATVIAIGRGNDNGHGVVSILDMTVYGTLIASANKVGITVLNVTV